MPIEVDIGDSTSVDFMATYVEAAQGRLDVPVNNAAILSTLTTRPLEQIPLAGLPLVECRLAHAALAADIRRLRPCLLPAQDPKDLLLVQRPVDALLVAERTQTVEALCTAQSPPALLRHRGPLLAVPRVTSVTLYGAANALLV